MSKWLEFLNLLLSFGPKLPEIMASIDIIVAEVQHIVDIIKGGVVMEAPGDLADIKIDGKVASAAVLDKEQEVMAACEQGGMMASEKFGGVFSNLLAFIKSNPELLQFLLLFLKK